MYLHQLLMFSPLKMRQKRSSRVRREIQAPPPNPQTILDLHLPERYQLYQRTENDPPENFLLADSGIFIDPQDQQQRNHRILIFGRSSWWNNWTNQMSEIYVDGTFKLAPPMFEQIYVIMARRGDWVFPVAQCLLTGQSEFVYSRLFGLIKAFSPNFNPTKVSLDFELAAILAISAAFPNCQIRGCYFHLMSNFKKKVAKLGLMHLYQNDLAFQKASRMITAIAFVPPADIPLALQFMQITVQNTQLEPILQWFMKYYTGTLRADGTLTESRFPIAMWNLHQRTLDGDHRTNNISEASHRRLQSLFSCSHPTIWKFIEILWKEQKNRDADYAQFVAGSQPLPKVKKFRDLDARILRIMNSYNPLNMDEFLRGIATNNQMGE